MNKPLILSLLIILSGCSLHKINNTDLVQKINHQPINEEQILSAHYCNMGFVNFEITKYKYYDEEDKRFTSYDIYNPEKCVLVRTHDKLIFLHRKGSNIQSPEYLTINKSNIVAIGLWKQGKGRQIQLKLKDRTLVLELLKNAVHQDATASDVVFEDIQRIGASVFKIKQLALPPPPPVILFHW